jgi:competence protein ComGF
VLLRDLLLFLLLLLLLLQQLNDRRETTTDIGTASTFTFAAGFTSARPDTTAHEPVATAKVIHEVAIVQNDAASKKKTEKRRRRKKNRNRSTS